MEGSEDAMVEIMNRGNKDQRELVHYVERRGRFYVTVA
jgi:hypothetical protein